MARALPIFFTFLYLMAMVRPVMPVFEYLVKKDYIAEFLCINKDKPMLNCDGQCFLSEMIKAEQEEKKQNLPAIDLREYPIGFVEILDFYFLNIHLGPEPVFSYNGSDPQQFLSFIFHPPKSLV